MAIFSEQKDKIEEKNKITVQKFQSQLTQQLHNLHKVVLTSAMQQENQLKKMEEDMQSFLSTKATVTSAVFYQYYGIVWRGRSSLLNHI